MSEQNHGLDTLKDIRQMMERSSRFISLSGLSGISAGFIALGGAWLGYREIQLNHAALIHPVSSGHDFSLSELSHSDLFHIALFTFIAALIAAFVFTYIRSRKNNIPIWGTTSRRLILNVALPMFAGGIFLLRLIKVFNRLCRGFDVKNERGHVIYPGPL